MAPRMTAKTFPPQTQVFRGKVEATLITSQGSLDNEQVSLPTITNKKAPGGCTNPGSYHVANHKPGTTVAKQHKQANRPYNLVPTANFRKHRPKIVELESRKHGKLVRYKINANRKPGSPAPLPPGLPETKVSSPALSGPSTSHQHSDTSICQYGNEASQDAHETSTKDAIHSGDVNGVATGHSNERQPSAQSTSLLGNYPVERPAKRARLSGQLRQELQAGPSTKLPQFETGLPSYPVTNSNGNGHRSDATTAVPPRPPPTVIPSASRPTKRPQLTHRTKLPAVPWNHTLSAQDPEGLGLLGLSGPLEQATRLGQPRQFQHSLQGQRAPRSQQPQHPQQPQQPQQLQQLQQSRRLHHSQELQRLQQPRQPERCGPSAQPQSSRHSEPSRAPGALPWKPSEHPGQSRKDILYPGECLKGPDEENSHFEEAFAEFLVAKAFASGAARHTLEEYHATPEYLAELEYQYRHHLAACHPRERERYLRGLPSRTEQETPNNNNNRNEVSSGGDDNGGSQQILATGGPSMA